MGAPVHRTSHPLPVIVYDMARSHRSDHTIMVQVASHGYAVVTVDHTYDTFTEFPDGRCSPRPILPDVPEGLRRGPPIPARLRGAARRRAQPRRRRQTTAPGPPGALDPQRIGAFGSSKATTVSPRSPTGACAGLSIDGPTSRPSPPIWTGRS